MKKEHIDQTNFVEVCIWTSKENKAVPGKNVGHVALKTPYGYISLWPGERKPRSTHTPALFQKIEGKFRTYLSVRPPDFKQSYESDCIAEAASEYLLRNIANIAECSEGETPYIFNQKNSSFLRISEQPTTILEDEYLLAIKLCEANVRIVLYSLDAKNTHDYFESMKNKIQGWRLIGSNMLSRIDSKSPENCASFAFQCLLVGGMYGELSVGNSWQTASAVTPDSLLRQVVAAKQMELRNYEQTKDWKCPGESSLQQIIHAYNILGISASSEDDFIVRSSSSRICNLM